MGEKSEPFVMAEDMQESCLFRKILWRMKKGWKTCVISIVDGVICVAADDRGRDELLENYYNPVCEQLTQRVIFSYRNEKRTDVRR